MFKRKLPTIISEANYGARKLFRPSDKAKYHSAGPRADDGVGDTSILPQSSTPQSEN